MRTNYPSHVHDGEHSDGCGRNEGSDDYNGYGTASTTASTTPTRSRRSPPFKCPPPQGRAAHSDPFIMLSSVSFFLTLCIVNNAAVPTPCVSLRTTYVSLPPMFVYFGCIQHAFVSYIL